MAESVRDVVIEEQHERPSTVTGSLVARVTI
jgi:hypothetical protein